MRIYINLQRINKVVNCNFETEDIFKVANSRMGWYRRCGMNVGNYKLSSKVLALANKKKGRTDVLILFFVVYAIVYNFSFL